MKGAKFKDFTPNEHRVWKTLFERQSVKRGEQIIPEFTNGLTALGIGAERIPDLASVNLRLRELTGWEGVAVEGLEDGKSFYGLLADRKFPIGNFIRAEEDISYTPAPDVFHDLYGHLPFYADQSYANFSEEFGKRASKYKDDPKILREFERYFWFTVEFGLIETPSGRRIFGAGIASSHGECEYALSTAPVVAPFDIEAIRAQEFRIDTYQQKLFLLNSQEQLYRSLDAFEKAYESPDHRTL